MARMIPTTPRDFHDSKGVAGSSPAYSTLRGYSGRASFWTESGGWGSDQLPRE